MLASPNLCASHQVRAAGTFLDSVLVVVVVVVLVVVVVALVVLVLVLVMLVLSGRYTAPVSVVLPQKTLTPNP